MPIAGAIRVIRRHHTLPAVGGRATNSENGLAASIRQRRVSLLAATQ